MVDHDLVSAVGTQRRLNGRRDGAAGIDVAKHSSIFRIVAVRGRRMLGALKHGKGFGGVWKRAYLL